jgi:protoheme IX farnesyltransferase
MRLISAYVSLTKPRIIALLLITTVTAMMVASRGFPPPALVLVTLIGGALSAGAANTFNCCLDRDIDALMTRTATRPLVSGAIKPNQALAFGGALALLSVLDLGLLVNWLAAALSVCGLLYYVLVYTCWLKRAMPSNIVIGGAAGAVPPLVGWAAVTGELSLVAAYLFAVIFLWTPPHFWALALLIRPEHERAKVPMLPVVRGERETRRQVLVYSVILVLFTLGILAFRQVGIFYAAAALVLGGVFVYHALRLWHEATSDAARRLFRYSILYLALLFTALVIDQWKW